MLSNARDLLSGKNIALVIIDVQNDYCSSKSPATRGGDHEFKREASRNTSKILEAARRTKIPVIHVKTIHSEWTDSPVWITRRENPGLVCRVGSWGQEWWDEFPENWPLPTEYVVVKHRWSAFHGTDLDLVLRSKRIESIILAGLSSAGCVDATAKDAFMLDYGVVILSDCTSAKTRESHESSLQRISHHHGILADSREVLSILESTSFPRIPSSNVRALTNSSAE